MRRKYNDIICALVLVRIGQELGTDSPTARAVADIIDSLALVARFFCT